MAKIETVPYTPLESTQLRLVVLNPGDGTDIECHMKTTTFKEIRESHNYEALSYEWGSADNARPIVIDGARYDIRENLWWALKFLRYTDKPRVLWIDALCINQNDLNERNHQVGQMDQIYEGAREVAIWVGREKLEDSCAITHMRELCYSHGDIPTRFDEDTDDWLPRNQISNIRWYDKHLGKWPTILTFCTRTYWNRLWIIQEVILAANATVYCGDKSINWTKIAKIISAVAAISYKGEVVNEEIRRKIKESPLSIIISQKPVENKGRRLIPILDLLLNNQNSLCDDVRDKVFGLLSLSENCCRQAVDVDYSQSLYMVCLKSLKHDLYQHAFNRQEPNTHHTKGFLDLVRNVKTLLQHNHALYSSGSWWRGYNDMLTLFQPLSTFTIENVDDNFEFEIRPVPWDYLNTVLSTLLNTSSAGPLIDRLPSNFSSKPGKDLYKVNTRRVSRSLRILPDMRALSVSIKICIDSTHQEVQLITTTFPKASEAQAPCPGVANTIIRSLAQVIQAAHVYSIRTSGEFAAGSGSAATCTLFLEKNRILGFGPYEMRPGDYICQIDHIGEVENTCNSADQFHDAVQSRLVMKGRVFSTKSLFGLPPERQSRFHFHPNISELFLFMKKAKNVEN